ncbi:MAG: hypothetical protein LBF83_04835, partial [Spirochaetaceae bacterium]|nr:hypothetical protein [Spirochaetaceae bacterium]
MSTDWLPPTREGQLAMAKDWQSVAGANADAWGIPAAAMTSFGTHIQTAEGALAAAKNETTRTPVATARCKEAFDVLTAFMRDFKRRYFLSPPLTDSGYVSLGLKPHDSTQTPGGNPTAQVTVETYLVGRHELGVKIVYVTGSPADGANKGYRVWYSALAPGETPPAAPKELRESFFTKRKKDVIEFDFGDSGKTRTSPCRWRTGARKAPGGRWFRRLLLPFRGGGGGILRSGSFTRGGFKMIKIFLVTGFI